MWWTTGFAWNPAKIKDDLTSWAALWDARLSRATSSMLDDDRECFAVGAFRLGLAPNTTSDADLDAIARPARAAEAARPDVQRRTTSAS